MDDLSWIVQAGLGTGLAVALMWVKSLREELKAQEDRLERIDQRAEANTAWLRDIAAEKLKRTDLNPP